jgi:hypothetical protein
MNQITNLRYEIRDGHSYVAFEFNGRPVWLGTENQKKWTEDAGYVFLGGEFAEDVPEFQVPLPWAPETTVVLRGWTDDPVVRAIYAQFGRDLAKGRLSPGPIPIPPPLA